MTGFDTMARTVWGEARGEGWLGKAAVAHVILNRVAAGSWYGDTIEEVCLKPRQFSCWNEEDPNHKKMRAVTLEDDIQFQACLAACAAAYWGLTSDPTDGCLHYMTIMRYEQGWPKSWGDPKEPHRRIGTHLFFDDID